MYDYCELGWPTNLNDMSVIGIVVYPNPTSGSQIETRLNIEVLVIDMQGKIIIEEENINTIDLSTYSKGIYNLKITTDGKSFINKIIKH